MMDYQMECRQEWEKNGKKSYLIKVKATFFVSAKIDDLDGENLA